MRARQRGIALLTAIILVAVAAIVATSIAWQSQLLARRGIAVFTVAQSVAFAQGAEAMAAYALRDNRQRNPQIVSTNQTWAKPYGPVEMDNGVVLEASLEDQQGKFNLNSVVYWNPQASTFELDKHQYDIFVTLLRDLDIDVRYADLLVDWIDPDIAPASSGGEDTLYLSQNPPYRPPNTFITHTSELLALPGFGRDNYLKIAPFVTALPNGETVNPCTASGLVLDVTLNDPNNQSQYRSVDLAQMREKGCWPVKADYTAPLSGPDKTKVEQRLDEKSKWFRLRTNIRIGTADFVLYSVLFREPSNKVRVVQRSFGSE